MKERAQKTVSTEISCNSVYSGFDALREKMILTTLKEKARASTQIN